MRSDYPEIHGRVTPFAGVWIEIDHTGNNKWDDAVTPFAGVWIEMVRTRWHWIKHCRHSLRGSVVVYVVDGLPEDADDFRYPGDAIEPEIQSELERALSGETVLPEKILDTDWGNIFIAYYPLYNESGEVIGALGIEVAADIEAEAVHDKSIIQRHGKY